MRMAETEKREGVVGREGAHWFTCDRCGAPTDATPLLTAFFPGHHSPSAVRLCRRCLEEFYDWMLYEKGV